MRHFDVQVSLFLSRLMSLVIEVCEDKLDKLDCGNLCDEMRNLVD
jgi:hypothetical protein